MVRYLVSEHAIERYYERGGTNPIDDELSKALPFGAGFGSGFMLMLPCGLVAAGKIWVEDGDRLKRITTVLTLEQATVNIQERGLNNQRLATKRSSDREKKKAEYDRERYREKPVPKPKGFKHRPQG